jgi:hypothetical protein
MKRIVTIICGALVVIAVCLAYSQLSALQKPVHAAGGINVVVICNSCASGDINNHGPVGSVLLDQNTGNVWLYPGDAIFGQGGPILLGKMSEIGKPIVPVKQ